jgi:hypothetical protein
MLSKKLAANGSRKKPFFRDENGGVAGTGIPSLIPVKDPCTTVSAFP